MHELGVLYQALKRVHTIAQQHNITQVRHITLEVGETSGYVPFFFQKLFPAAADSFPELQNAKLLIETVAGSGLQIKNIGY